MSGGNLSPRQKMINMMYLVLIALLALNVSKQILESFHMIEISFNKAKENLDEKIDMKIKGLQAQVSNDPSLKPYLDRATEAKKVTDDFVAYIDGIIQEVSDKAEGRKELEDGQEGTGKYYDTELKGSDNIELHANYFFVDDANKTKEKGWKAKELEDQINKTREKLLALLDTNGMSMEGNPREEVERATMLRAEVSEAEKEEYPSWSNKYLEHAPLAAVVALLTKVQNDAKTTEAAVVDKLSLGRETVIEVKELVPIVKTNSNVVMLGEEYKAEVFLAARTSVDENTTFQLTSGGSGPLEKEEGKGIYSVRPNSQGVFTWGGVIKVTTKKGVEEYPFTSEYQAFQGGASISATKMNMLYIGVENPISVAVPGVNPADITASISAGSLSRSGGNYVANVTTPGNATISVSAKLGDGTVRTVGKQEYRVRRLPKPEARWGSLESGRPAPKAALLAQPSITAGMGAEFAFEGLRYSVVSYQFIYAPRRGEALVVQANGSAIHGGIKGAISKAQRGDRIIVDKIRASGPGGTPTLQPIIIEIQ